MSNAFMASAKKSKREQAAIEKPMAAPDEPEEYVGINVRLPKSLHRKVQLHRVETGESMTQLVRRVLAEELGE